ncbi:MAG: methyltransferase domain-containing protein [Thaumarchaeota archaeon]|nr:methyltransferase domain-containing protein [Nitrososphaerota archaeon]
MSWTDSKAEWDEFVRMLSPGPGEKILDVGAGKGVVAGRVLDASKGALVHAVDPNEKRVAKMQSDFPGLRASVAGAEKLPFADSDFDKAYTTMAMHHYANIDGALSEIARVLKHGGTFVILEMEPGSLMGRIFRLFGKIGGEHMTVMREDQLLAKLKARGDYRVSNSTKLGAKYLIELTRV